MKPVIVFGRQGQVARELAALTATPPLLFLGRAEVDLDGGPDLGRVLDDAGAVGVINAAAYTAVDRAESEPDAAFRLNRDAPAAMARACAERAIPFVHISTDYVFDGEKVGPYVETDAKNPQCVYGLSKSQGEDAVLAAGGIHAILRTAWVFSSFGGNFLKTMLRLAGTRPEVGVVDDQQGRPTWARDVALAATAALDAMHLDGTALGILHAAGGQDTSWADFATMIFAEQARRGRPFAAVRRIGTQDYPTSARRPRNSRLETARAQAVLGWRAAPLPDAISTVLDQLEHTP